MIENATTPQVMCRMSCFSGLSGRNHGDRETTAQPGPSEQVGEDEGIRLDVAEAAARVLAMPVSQGKTYELGGPRAYPYKEFLRLVLAETGRKRLLIPVPYVVWDILALLMSPLPRAPISSDQVTLMKRDNVVAVDALTGGVRRMRTSLHCARMPELRLRRAAATPQELRRG